MPHLANDNRNAIVSMLAHERNCKDIDEAIGCDSTIISKEIKKNQIISNPSKLKSKILCKKLDRFPYVWNLFKKIYDMYSKKNKHKLRYGIYIN